MNIREVREKAEQIFCEGADSWFAEPVLLANYILATIDPEPEAAITGKWLREEWGWDNHGTMSMHYDHDEYTAFSWQQEDGLAIVAKSHQLRCYTTGFPVHTRQQFCDLARALGIPRRQTKPEPKGCTCLDSPNMLYAPCSYCESRRKDGAK